MNEIVAHLRDKGFALRSAPAMEAWLKWSWSDWSRFAASWNDLGSDNYMADGGRYRRRRYAVFEGNANQMVRTPHQPHYQARVYNRLNGGLERWFEPVLPSVADSPIIQAVIRRLASVFQGMVGGPEREISWHVELHQFRIEAGAVTEGRPTPEGVHRDGVDGAFVMLINRENVESGVTQIFDPQGVSLGNFILADPGDAVFLDDARVFHGVTPITPSDPTRPAVRDVLVITFTCRS